MIAGREAGPLHPQGAPVDAKAGADGALYLTEDTNGTVLRLSRDAAADR